MSYAASARPLIPPDLEALLRRGAFFASSSHVPRLEEQRLLELLGRALPGIAILIVIRQSEDKVRSIGEGVELGAVPQLNGAGEPGGPAEDVGRFGGYLTRCLPVAARR